MEPEVALGKVLCALREAASYSQEQLALEEDHQRNYVSLLERGLNSATLKTLYKLSSVLKVSPGKMLD